MNEVINVEAKITDINKTYYVQIDTANNRCVIHTEFADPQYDYHLETQSNLLVDLVNELKDVKVDDRIIDGNKALELSYEGCFKDVVKAIIKSIGKKNVFLTLTSLFAKLKKKLKTDISVNRIIKLIMKEVSDLDDWQLDII